MTKIFKLNGIDCAHCASKMETAINKIDGVENAKINFMTQKLKIDADEKIFVELLPKVAKVCKKIEPDCEIIF